MKVCAEYLQVRDGSVLRDGRFKFPGVQEDVDHLLEIAAPERAALVRAKRDCAGNLRHRHSSCLRSERSCPSAWAIIARLIRE